MLSSLPKRINMTQSYEDAPIVAASVHSRPEQPNLSDEKLDEIADHWGIVVTLNDGRKFLVHSTPETGVVATDAKNMSDRWRKSADLAVNGAKTIGGMLRASKDVQGDACNAALKRYLKLDVGKVLTGAGVSQENAEKWAPWLVKTMYDYGINSPSHRAMFLAQILHESGNLKYLEENLYYTTAKALQNAFGKRVAGREESLLKDPNPNSNSGTKKERIAERIANVVYAGMLGNGDEASGDGWKYRGRGLIQLTGKDNYKKYDESSKSGALANPDILLEPKFAADSAGWFWSSRGINNKMDDAVGKGDDVTAAATKPINGTDRLEERRNKYEAITKNLDLLE